MPKINFITADGTSAQIDADAGLTVMEVAIKNDIAGITAECGGACACATCHVYVEERSALPKAEEMERDMLEFAWEPNEKSRLSCQIKLTDEMEGMTFVIPAEQA